MLVVFDNNVAIGLRARSGDLIVGRESDALIILGGGSFAC
jgi:hypothetical protein